MHGLSRKFEDFNVSRTLKNSVFFDKYCCQKTYIPEAISLVVQHH